MPTTARKRDYGTIVLFLVVAVVLFYLATNNANPYDVTTDTEVQTERIEEDDPRWDCETMGNRVCGPEAR
jgi:hypothetical protein